MSVKVYYIRHGAHGKIHRMSVDQETGFLYTNGSCHVDDIKQAVSDHGILPIVAALRLDYIRGWQANGERICKHCYGADLKALPKLRRRVRKVPNRVVFQASQGSPVEADDGPGDVAPEAAALRPGVLA